MENPDHHSAARRSSQYCKVSSVFLCFLFLLTTRLYAQIVIHYNADSEPVKFGATHLELALKKNGHFVRKNFSQSDTQNSDISILVSKKVPSLKKEGYAISHELKKITITAIDPVGAMYGALDLAEQLQMGRSLQEIDGRIANPYLSVRALKFNLPWSSYRTGVVMEQHTEVCKDLGFWQSFLDQMALNRFNVLSLWNVHPFSYMIKPINFPGANNFSEQEMQQWKDFWTRLFRMAKDRGIETFIVNWNIAVSPEFATTYGVQERNDTSSVVKRYTREVVTQVINEYPDLSGIGITLADWMSNFRSAGSPLPEMTAKDREDWIEETVVAGIKNANRPVKFLHRSVLSSDPTEMRRVINNAKLTDTTLVEIKFNWSHGHSTPLLALTHDAHSGKVDNGYWNPMPDNYRIQWMIRNEDFFILRWGQPDFIKKHLTENTKPYVNGYFIGSEGYIPAKDISHKENTTHKTWKYAFEKQWLFYKTWGRLLYDPRTPNSVFESEFETRYDRRYSRELLKAFSAASKMPLLLASFHGATWDYTLYSEGFLAPFPSNEGLYDKASAFISIDELINHQPLDPKYISIADFVKISIEKKTRSSEKLTPLQLADSLEKNSDTVIKIVMQIRPGASSALACELDDLETWSLLSQYLSDKIRAGVAMETFRKTKDNSQQQKAVKLLTACLEHWKKIAELTSAHYIEVPYLDDQSTGGQPLNDARTFSWSKYLPEVERDIVIAKEGSQLKR
ncbi:MAG: hypothetical protein C0490_01620 [Marivirga sp.]|nr:hypothetical protein [Marivirga sp.]